MLSNIVQATPTAELTARLEVEAATMNSTPADSHEHHNALRWHEAIAAELWYRNARFRVAH